MAEASATPNPRNLNLDHLRVVMLLLGVPLHGALPFLPGGGWLVEAERTSVLLQGLSDVIHAFRMPVFFLLSGLFAVGAIRKAGRLGWLARRWRLLLPPLLFGFLAINPLQDWLIGLYEADHGSDAVRTSATYHLWFLVVLLAFSALIAALPSLLGVYGATMSRLRRTVGRHAPAAAVPTVMLVNAGLSLAAILLADATCRLLLGRPFPASLNLFALYLPFFLFGWHLASDEEARSAFLSVGAGGWVLAAGALAVTVAVSADPALRAAWCDPAWLVAGWFTARVVVSAFATASRPLLPAMPFRPEFGLPFYLLHHPFVLVFALAMEQLPLSPWQAFAAIVVLTTASTLIAVRVVERSRLLLFLFGVPVAPRSGPAAVSRHGPALGDFVPRP